MHLYKQISQKSSVSHWKNGKLNTVNKGSLGEDNWMDNVDFLKNCRNVKGGVDF